MGVRNSHMATTSSSKPSELMKKIHGWFMIFTGYAFGLFGLAILVSYLQTFINILGVNPYVILVFVCTLALNLMGAYVIHRSKD
jgi:hypothetical protein